MRSFILGTDWWTDCDDAVALRILSRAHKAGEVNLLGIGINACMQYSVSSLTGFLRNEGVADVRIGIDSEAVDFGGDPPYQKRLSALAEDIDNSMAENAVDMYIDILRNTGDKIEILEIGYPQVVSEVIRREPLLFAEKVAKVWMMGGRWDGPDLKENNFSRNARASAAAAFFCENCPVPVTFLGFEIGCDVYTGKHLADGDVLKNVLADHGCAEKGRCSWDPMLILLAIAGDEEKAGYGCIRGQAIVNPETGTNNFKLDCNGKHCCVIKNRNNEYYRILIDSLI